MKRKRSSRRSKKIPALATAGALVFGMKAYEGYAGKAGSAGGAKGIAWTTLGIDNAGQFHMGKFIENITPLAAGVGGSMLAAKSGANRYLAKVPLLKL